MQTGLVRGWGRVVLLILMMSITSLAVAQEPPADLDVVIAAEGTARVVVSLRAEAGDTVGVAETQDELLTDLAETDFVLLHQFEQLPGLVGEADAAALETLQQHPEVEAVALDMPVSIALTESVNFIGAEAVTGQLGITGAGVTIAVIDTGIDVDHPAFGGRVIGQQCFTRDNCPPNDSNQSNVADDENGHGTHVAGIIAGEQGVAPDAGLVAVRVLNEAGNGFTSDVLAGIDWIVANQAALDIDIINLSLGGGRFLSVCDTADANTQLYAQALAAASEVGMLVFAASGNSGFEDALLSPACVSTAISVGNSYHFSSSGVQWATCTDQDVVPDVVSCISNSSPDLDLLAPGVSIRSTGLNGGTAEKSGTSMAAAHATGVAALLLEADPTLSPEAIRQLLKDTGVPVTDSRNGITTPRVDALAAVRAVTPIEDVIITGQVLLEGRGEHGGIELRFSEAACGLSDAPDLTTFTERDGTFSISVDATVVYRCVQAVREGYLIAERANPGGDIGRTTLLAGDITGDSVINIFDLSILSANYESENAAADINGSGSVDLFDLVLLAGNYDAIGPTTW